MIEYINHIISIFTEYSKEYPVIAGAVAVWGLGVSSYLSRNIPRHIISIAERQLTVSLSIYNTSIGFYSFLEWCDKHNYTNGFRSLKLTGGKWGEDESRKGIGYGNHYIIFRKRPIKISLEKIDNNNSSMEREVLTVTTIGRSHRFFDSLFLEIEEIEEHESKKSEILVYEYSGDCGWRIGPKQFKREIESVFLRAGIRERVIGHIENFIQKESWCIEHGLPYQTGILLYGDSGCGKTSLIKAIASKFKRKIYIISVAHLHELRQAILGLPKDAILVIEDIDSEDALLSRKKEKSPGKIDFKMSLANLSDILNSLDGLISCHGRILIATTNYKEKLDDALLRNGRFDLKVELSFADEHVVTQFFNFFFPSFALPNNFKVKERIPMSKIQFLLFKHENDPQIIFDEITRPGC